MGLADAMKRLRRRAPLSLLLLVCLLTALVLLYRLVLGEAEAGHNGANVRFALSGATFPDANRKLPHLLDKRTDSSSSSFLTQNPRHVERQKQVKAHLLANIQKMAHETNGEDSSGRKLGLFEGIPALQATESLRLWRRRGKEPFPPPSSSSAFPVLVHLDLKGAAPKVSYLEQVFPLFRQLGATGLLLEYEDTFPFWGPALGQIGARDAYSVPEVLRIRELASEHRLELVPLVQTFGHLEFLLKLGKFAHLREAAKYPQAICPTHNDSLPLLLAMLDQVLELHPDARALHIGADEVYQLGTCPRCLTRMRREQRTRRHGDPRAAIFLAHVAAVAKHLRQKKIMPLMWDDHLRSIPENLLRDSGLGDLVQVVVWKYDSEVLSSIPPSLWDKYSRTMGGAWVASAFKGADGPDALHPHVLRRLENHRAWRQALSLHRQRLHMRGAVLTGWQRYDHFAVLCELLPVGLPSLALSMVELLNTPGDEDKVSKACKILGCDAPDAPQALLEDPASRERVLQCTFPGAEVFLGVQKLLQVGVRLRDMLRDPGVRGWMAPVQSRRFYSSPAQVERATTELDRLIMGLGQLRDDMQNALDEIYKPSTVSEWMETHVDPIQGQLLDLWERRQRILNRTQWERRPLDMVDFG